MELQNKVSFLPTVCGIEIDASASYLPAADGALQPFANTHINTETAQKVYFSRGAVSITETSEDTRAGTMYTHELTIRFPNGDFFRSFRQQQYKKAAFIYIKLSGGMTLLFGRNDYFKNSRLKINTSANHRAASVTYTCTSIFPLGITNGADALIIEGDFPLNFITP